eukprot:1840393-Lingulodinium_polyedra.AAC.1
MTAPSCEALCRIDACPATSLPPFTRVERVMLSSRSISDERAVGRSVLELSVGLARGKDRGLGIVEH